MGPIRSGAHETLIRHQIQLVKTRIVQVYQVDYSSGGSRSSKGYEVGKLVNEDIS